MKSYATAASGAADSTLQTERFQKAPAQRSASPISQAVANCFTPAVKPSAVADGVSFVSPKPNSLPGDLLSPESKRLINKPGGDSPEHFSAEKKDLLAKVRHTLPDYVRRPGSSSSKRILDFDTFIQDASAAKNHSQIQNEAAKSSALLHALSDALLKQKNGSAIVQLNALALESPHYPEASQHFLKAMQQLTGKTISSLSECWAHLNGHAEFSGKNLLFTHVDVEGVGMLRFMSVSGRNQIPKVGVKLGIPVNKGNAKLLCTPLLQHSNTNEQCRVQANARNLNPVKSERGRIFYLGYEDLLLSVQGRNKEPRILPRTKTPDQYGGVFDRARDTEYMVLSALGMLLKQKPAWADKPMSITMYSKLPMCPACHSAASHAILSKEFAQLKSLTVFSNH